MTFDMARETIPCLDTKNAHQLLELRAKMMSGQTLSHEEKVQATHFVTAVAFGIAAASSRPSNEEAADAWAWAFLTALIDPLS